MNAFRSTLARDFTLRLGFLHITDEISKTLRV